MSIRVLRIDIETAPNLAYVWGLFKETVVIDRLIEPGYTLCYAAQWEGEEEMLFDSVHQSPMDDMLSDLHDLLEEADVVVHYNGKKFDMPVINREFVKHGFLPPSPYQQIDLYHTVRRNFRFASNKLDFVARELGLGAKVQHKGMDLWKDCMATMDYDFGEQCPEHIEQAWKEMQQYNEQDVVLLGRLYERLQPWVPNHPNRALFMDVDADPACPSCGSSDVRFKGYKHTRTMRYKQYQCNDCGSWSRARLSEKPTRKELLR
jgi:hypothetical protein